VLGKGWPSKSSRDPQQIVSWFAATNHGLAVHLGPSGLMAFDVDNPGQLPEVLAELFTTSAPPFQSTRTGQPGRGHFLFRVPPERHIGNSLGALPAGWGDVRRMNVGLRRRKNKEIKGHLLDTVDGKWSRESDLTKNDASAPDQVHGDRVQRVVPYVEDHRNALLIHLDSAVPDEQRMAAMYALKRGVEAVFQLESAELAVEPLPGGSGDLAWSRLLMFEAAEGGAGVLRRLATEQGQVRAVARKALVILHFDPDTGADRGKAEHATEPCSQLQLGLPLRGELRGAQHHEPLGVAAGDELGSDETGLDGLADSHTVGDEQPGGVLGGGHHQRDELVVAGADRELGEAPEGAGRGAEAQPQRVPEQAGSPGVTTVGDGWRVEGRGLGVVQGGQQGGGLVVAAAEGPGEDDLGRAAGQHEPLASAGADQGARTELCRRHAVARPAPKTPGFSATICPHAVSLSA